LTDTLSDILDSNDEEEGEPVERLPFVTAEDMLKKVKENMDSINDEDSRIPFNDRYTSFLKDNNVMMLVSKNRLYPSTR